MSRKSKPASKPRTKLAIVRSVSALRKTVAGFRGKGARIALVPTMGALHAGHISLVRAAQQRADRVVVSIFVNPAQFAPTEDLASYPRTWDADVAALARMQVDVIWAPTVATMYPSGLATQVVPAGPAKAGLEDAFRPHFFGGVCTVVAKLLLQVGPDFAMFGEKDFQQLAVVTAMTRDLDIPTRIVGVPTVREKDGLAMSSRNAYLSAAERATAPALNRTLKACAVRIKRGDTIAATLADGKRELEAAGFVVDYLEARNASTLEPAQSSSDRPLRLLVAAKLGRTRLIDNIAV
jgi:pantoate--beta-alanine ligase